MAKPISYLIARAVFLSFFALGMLPLHANAGLDAISQATTTGSPQVDNQEHILSGLAQTIASTLTASASANAAYGTLGVSAWADGSGLVYQGYGRGAASFSDFLLVGSDSGLKDGTAVTLIITKELSGTISGGSIYGTEAHIILNVSGTAAYSQNIYPSSTTFSGNLDPFYIYTTVGALVPFIVSLEATALDYSAGSVSVDFSHTANIYADAFTPGVTLTSTSGHDYSFPTAVPEPEIYAMLGLGLGLLGWVGRRRKLQAA